MRLLVLTPDAATALASLDPSALAEALASSNWKGLTLAWTEADVFAGDPAPAADRMTLIDRAHAALPTVETLVDYASRRRWEVEVAGTTWNGWPVATDDRSKVLVDGELTAIDLGVREDGEHFKFADGTPRPLTNPEMQQVAIAMRAHVKATFGALFGILAGIQGGTITTQAQVDAELAKVA